MSFVSLRSIFILASLCFLTSAQADSEIWLAPRTDALPGKGTATDPYNAGTQQKFDALLSRYFTAGTPNLTFHLAPGTYHTMGEHGHWQCLSNWKFHGAGMDSTVIKLAGWVYSGLSGGNIAFSTRAWFKAGIEVTDLTIDCSWLDFGSALAGSFTVPAPGHTVAVPVVSSTWATIGKYAWLQRKDDYRVVGLYEVKAVTDGTDVVLQNLQGSDNNARINLPQGTLVTGPVFVGPAVNTCGIDIGSKDCKVERVHVTDSGTPISESALGIALSHVNHGGGPFYLADGNVIRDCLIDNLWGSYGWCIFMGSSNPAENNGAFISAVVEDNIIHSNGMHQGLASWGTANAIWSHNTVSNCQIGWFVDVGYNQDAQIINNTFLNNSEGIQLGGGEDGKYANGWLRLNISGNHILVPQHGAGILSNGEVHQSVFANNQILTAAGTTTGSGIDVTPYHTDGNIYSNNTLSPVLTNGVPASAGCGFNNITTSGSAITMGATVKP